MVWCKLPLLPGDADIDQLRSGLASTAARRSHILLAGILADISFCSTFAANLKAAMAMFNTNFAGSVGGLTWMFLDWRLERKWSVVGFCTGAICGLVAIVSSLPIYRSYSLIFTNRLRRLASSAFVG